MNVTTASAIHVLRPQILERRARLQAAAGAIPAGYVNELLAEIDAALSRIDGGTFGRCETCHDPIEPDLLERDPIARFCLDHLSPEQRKAHEDDLTLATQIQTRLLPPRDIVLDQWETHYRYEPAGAVGGDYCEMIPSADGRALFFAVGDVAGKGVAASLLMTHISAIFRSLLSVELPVADVIARANRLLCDSTAAAHYATLVCGRATTTGIELVNAGHCRPLLLRRHAVQRIEATGLPLGLIPSTRYEVAHMGLNPGDRLIMYSDGITEAQDPGGNDFGEEMLAASLRSHCNSDARTMAEGVADDVTRFRAGRPPSDDITLLVLHRRSVVE
jgi:sigma-B regulation protein RsbU (phosphoserine phosphatase)